MNHWKAVIEALGAQLEKKEWEIKTLEKDVESLKKKIGELESENQALRMKLMNSFVPATAPEKIVEVTAQ